jgi:hypothetical protein
MKKSGLVLSLMVFIQFPSSGQTDELKKLVETLQGTFTKVESATKTYDQEIKLVEYSTMNYTFNQTDQKGIRTTYSSDFNLADIDPYAVRQETQKDIIYVVLTAKNKQKLIKTIKNGQTEPYDDELRLHAKDIDHARVILDLIKKAIPLGEKITAGKLKLSGYETMRQWLEDNVKNVGYGNKSIEQKITGQQYPGSVRLLQIESDGKVAHQNEFVFNLADINVNGLVYKISGNSFSLQLDMLDRLKSVGVKRDGVTKNFDDGVTIYTNGVDEARDLKTVLSLIVPLAQAKVKSDLPSPKNADECLNALAGFVKDVKINNKTFAQSLAPACISKLSSVEQSANTTVRNTFEFNWMDINPNTYRLLVSGEKMQIELPAVDKKKVVNHVKDDKPAGYENEATILVEDMEAGRRLRYLIGKTIDFCKTNYKDPFPNDPPALANWLKEQVTDVTVEQVSQKQSLEFVEEGNLNKLKLTAVEIKSSSSVEEIFEFNISDINPNSVDLEIKGKWLYLKFETNFKNKIIKAYKAGKIQPYVYSVALAMKDLETARGIIGGLKKCIAYEKTK